MSFLEHLSVESHKDIIIKAVSLNWVKALGAGLLSAYQIYFPEMDVVIAISILVIFDTTLGFINAIRTKSVSSSDLFRVLIKFMVYSMLLIMSKILMSEIPYLYPYKVVKSFLIMTESLSILENSAKLGVPIPTKLVAILKQVGDFKSNTKKKK